MSLLCTDTFPFEGHIHHISVVLCISHYVCFFTRIAFPTPYCTQIRQVVKVWQFVHFGFPHSDRPLLPCGHNSRSTRTAWIPFWKLVDRPVISVVNSPSRPSKAFGQTDCHFWDFWTDWLRRRDMTTSRRLWKGGQGKISKIIYKRDYAH